MAPLFRLPLFRFFPPIGTSIESFFNRRLNIILFLIGRYLLILGMVITVYLVYFFS